jgi:hypothetical protein
MAVSTSPHIRSLREATHAKESSSLKDEHEPEIERKTKRASTLELMKETLRYEKYCKYWAILSNVAAVVSITTTIFSTLKKSRWL